MHRKPGPLAPNTRLPSCPTSVTHEHILPRQWSLGILKAKTDLALWRALSYDMCPAVSQACIIFSCTFPQVCLYLPPSLVYTPFSAAAQACATHSCSPMLPLYFPRLVCTFPHLLSTPPSWQSCSHEPHSGPHCHWSTSLQRTLPKGLCCQDFSNVHICPSHSPLSSSGCLLPPGPTQNSSVCPACEAFPNLTLPFKPSCA